MYCIDLVFLQYCIVLFCDIFWILCLIYHFVLCGTHHQYSVQQILWRASRACVVRWLVRPGRRGRASKSRGLSLLSRGFGWLVAPTPAAARSRPAVRYFLDFPRSSPSLSAARSTASPTPEYSTTAFQVHRGGSNPRVLFLSLSLSSFPVTGGLSSFRPGPSVCSTDPSRA